MRIGLSHAVLAAVITATASAAAQAAPPVETNPFDVASKISDWFMSMTNRWDQFVTRQERQQLGRTLDTACKSLFDIRSRSVRLAQAIPIDAPGAAVRQNLRAEIQALRSSMAAATSNITKIAAEIDSLNPQTAVAIIDTINSNPMSFGAIDAELRGTTWRPKVLRAALGDGAVVLLQVHNAIAAFRTRLVSM